MRSLALNYSGVVIDQNQPPQSDVAYQTLSNSWFYQTFQLPLNYERGTNEGELYYPDLSGFQLFVSITPGDASIASLQWTIDQYIGNSGWSNLATGTTVGSHADGEQVWYDVLFSKTIPVNGSMITGPNSTLRFGFISEAGVTAAWYSQPNPLNLYGAYNSSMSALTASGNTFSFCFRILGLVADTGVDFLGNSYRSIALQNSPTNTDTTGIFDDGAGYWLSDPCPSQFGVKSIYFDVRPVAEIPIFGAMNLIGNPSFEYDAIGASPAWWTISGTFSTAGVQNGWSASGAQSLRLTTTIPANTSYGIEYSDIIINPNENCYFISSVNVLEAPTTHEISLIISWYNGATLISTSQSTFTGSGIYTFPDTIFTPPVGTTNATVQFSIVNNNSSSEAFDMYVDGFMLINAPEFIPYFDGDSIGYEWIEQKGNSPSVQVLNAQVANEPVVIDAIYLDPLTPSVGFNVYFSNDDSNNTPGGLAPTSETGWERKLWTHVPKTYTTSVAQQYYLPFPIVAKYVMIEFSALQARSYNPGNFSLPVKYKKYPKWVADFFINQMQLPTFIASQVNVSYDALDFAYNYYLDDINEAPASPGLATPDDISTINSFFSSLNDASDQVDPTTLAQINLVMNTFTNPPGALANSNTLLGNVVQQSNSTNAINYPVEGNPASPNVDYSFVSSLNRQQVVYEQSMPIMYFYLVSRHHYREQTATFDNNRAYFAGIKALAFMRNNYSTMKDGTQYIETGGDFVNAALNDWVLDPYGNLWTYDVSG
jgi:hypothetical protein